MKILLLCPTYFDLYIPILDELKHQGHEVHFVEDNEIPGDHYRRASYVFYELYRSYKRWICNRKQVFEHYWENKIAEDKALSESYDILFAINGCSFHPYLQQHLKNYNKNIRSILYVWDTEEYYYYYRNKSFFQKVLTFDYNDSKKNNIPFLPFYWTENESTLETIKYKLSIVGSNHDGRNRIVSSVAEQLDNIGIKNYLFKIYSERRNLYPIERLKKIVAILCHNIDTVEELKIIEGKINSRFIVNQPVSFSNVNKIISESEIILDTDRESQTGTTPRVIWALAKRKKVISTNKNLKKMPFYSPEQISIIDRHSPKIDERFLTGVSTERHPYLEGLRIDKWVQFVIS